MLWLKVLIPILMLAIALIEIALERKWHDKRTNLNKCWLKGLIFLLILSAIATSAVIYDDFNKLKQSEKIIYALRNSGVIRNEVILDSSKNIFPKIQIGNEGPFFQGGLTIFKERGLEVKSIEGQIYVSISIADSNGNLIAEINDNEWKTNPSFSFDRNYSKDTFEVKDNHGNIVLQVRIKGNILQFQGILYDPIKKLYWLAAQDERDGSMDAIFEIQSKIEEFRHSIKPIFKYPSDQHLGELVKD